MLRNDYLSAIWVFKPLNFTSFSVDINFLGANHQFCSGSIYF